MINIVRGGVIVHIEEETRLIEEICEKHNLKPEYFSELFNLEKEYANKNMARRAGVFQDLKEMIGSWAKEG